VGYGALKRGWPAANHPEIEGERPNRRLRLESLPRPKRECDLLRDLRIADKREEIFAIEIIVYAKPLTSLGTTRSIIYRLAKLQA
jgi:hypothetical protein